MSSPWKPFTTLKHHLDRMKFLGYLQWYRKHICFSVQSVTSKKKASKVKGKVRTAITLLQKDSIKREAAEAAWLLSEHKGAKAAIEIVALLCGIEIDDT